VSATLQEHEIEPVPGLPERLPAGERILWQGAPRWQDLARRVFLVRWIGAYFAVLFLWRLTAALAAGEPAPSAAGPLAALAAGGAAAVGLLALLAWAIERTTLYTITSARVVLRVGVALPMTINVPHRIIQSVALKTAGSGGDVALAIAGPDRVAYLSLWPHARRWRWARPEPTLRCIANAAQVGELLAQALAGASPSPLPAAAAAPSRACGLAAAQG
jgi:hypothetical protein